MALRLAGEEYSLVQGLDAQGWLERISVNKSTPALLVEQASSGYILHLKSQGYSVLAASLNEVTIYQPLNMYSNSVLGLNALTAYPNLHLTLKPGSTAKSVVVQELVGQTEEILVAKNSAGNTLSGIAASGKIFITPYVDDDLQNYNAGKGIVVRTPDGTKDYRIRVDNAGAVATDLIA